MARQYSTKSFLRQAPNHLLQRYLTEVGIGEGFPWKHLGARDTDLIHREIERAPDPLRRQIDRDFREVYAMADEGGTRTLIDEGRDYHHNVELAGTFGEMSGHLERAFWTFLEHPRVFHVAQRFHHADRIGRWHKWQDLPETEAATDEESYKRLEANISEYYSRAEGRGYQCQVDHYQRDSRLYWFAYPEDYAESRLIWEEHELRSATQRPAFEVIFVYDQEDRWLDLHARGGRKVARELLLVFGRAILGVDLKDIDEGAAYELNGLLNPDFRFALKPTDGVDQARLRSIRVRILGHGNRRITLEANASQDPEAVRRMLDVVLGTGGIPRDLVVVDRVSLQLVFRQGVSKQQQLSFYVAHPNTCSLKHNPEDEIARQLLQRWGLDVSGRAKGSASERRRSAQYVIRH